MPKKATFKAMDAVGGRKSCPEDIEMSRDSAEYAVVARRKVWAFPFEVLRSRHTKIGCSGKLRTDDNLFRFGVALATLHTDID